MERLTEWEEKDPKELLKKKNNPAVSPMIKILRVWSQNWVLSNCPTFKLLIYSQRTIKSSLSKTPMFMALFRTKQLFAQESPKRFRSKTVLLMWFQKFPLNSWRDWSLKTWFPKEQPKKRKLKTKEKRLKRKIVINKWINIIPFKFSSAFFMKGFMV